MIEPPFQSQLCFLRQVCLGNLGLANQVRQVIHWALSLLAKQTDLNLGQVLYFLYPLFCMILFLLFQLHYTFFSAPLSRDLHLVLATHIGPTMYKSAFTILQLICWDLIPCNALFPYRCSVFAGLLLTLINSPAGPTSSGFYLLLRLRQEITWSNLAWTT